MVKTTFIILMLIFSGQIQATPFMKKVSEGVLDKLYEANGNQIYVKPQIIITVSEKNAALFLLRANTIELSQKAYQVCQSMGKDSLSALAYVLGHELAHAYQKDLAANSTSFLAYDRQQNSSLFFEESADVQGVFLAYLAGYQTTDILKDLINRIYEKFNLPDELTGYPSLAERQNTTAKVQAMSTELIRIYEAGNYLLAIDKYDLAVACFEYVEHWYKGREVYNNLGVAYTYLALNFASKNVEPFLFPLEISWTTRMKKPLGKRGGEDLSIEEQRLRKLYLQKAEDYFIIASKMNPQLLAPEINLMCVDILKGNAGKAIEYYNSHNLQKRVLLENNDSAIRQKVRLALALAYVNNHESKKAIRIWEDIQATGIGLAAFQAEFNLKMQNGEACEAENMADCPDIPETQILIDGIKLHRPQASRDWILLQSINRVEVAFTQTPNSLVYTFKDKARTFSMQRVFAPLTAIPKDLFSTESVLTNNGNISVCQNSKLAFLINDQNNLIEWLKYY